MYNLILTEYAVDKLAPVVKWLTIGLAVAFIAFMLIAFFACKVKGKGELFGKVLKYGAIAVIVYLAIVGIVMLVLEIAKSYSTGYLEDNWVSKDIIKLVFVPILSTIVLCVAFGVVALIVSRKKPNLLRIVGIVGGIICAISIIVTVVLIASYYSENIVGDGYYTDESSKFNASALYICAGLLVFVALVTAFIVGKKGGFYFDTHAISLAGICVALSFGLSFIKIWRMPQGGSVTLVSMLPIMIYSYVYGMKKGLIVGLTYGLLQAVQDPYIVHPAQFLLDYPLAFAMTAFAGLLSDFKCLEKLPQVKFAISAVIGGIFRAVSHIFAGVFAFGSYAVSSGATDFWVYSTVYNLYVLIDVALVVIVGITLFSSKGFRKELARFKGEF